MRWNVNASEASRTNTFNAILQSSNNSARANAGNYYCVSQEIFATIQITGIPNRQCDSAFHQRTAADYDVLERHAPSAAHDFRIALEIRC
jgi:hypothetical protein